jgi:NhaP-type Na+/H+ or K+/H+ antiporter
MTYAVVAFSLLVQGMTVRMALPASGDANRAG